MSYYERLTDDARKVMSFANEEAQKLNHEYIGTEHVLLGICHYLEKDGKESISRIFNSYDLSTDSIRKEIRRLVHAGPDMVTMGRLPQTPRAKKIFEYAMTEARDANQNYVDIKDIFLGILQEQEGVAAQVLYNLNSALVHADIVRDTTRSLLEEKLDTKCDDNFLLTEIEEHDDDFLRLDLEEQPQTPENWTIPRSKMNIEQFLRCCGYEFNENEVSTRKDSTIRVVGYYEKESSMGEQLKLVYNSQCPEQVNEVIELRNLLDANQVSYKENPTRTEVAEALRKRADENRNLADIIDGKED